MRVLHIIAGAATGGAETFAQDAVSALAERGIEQHVIGRPHPIAAARYEAAGVGFSPFGFTAFDRLRRGTLRTRAASFGADIVHAWMARAASFVPGGMPCPVLGWFGGYYDLKYYRRADFLAGVTRDIVRDLVARGAPADRVSVVHTFGTLPDSAPVERAALGTPEHAPVVLVLSRLHEKKGIDTILRAVATLPGFYLWLAGEGPERERYKTLAERLGVGERVRFLGWRTDRKSLLAACDVCALPSRYEPFGTVMPEAWSMRKPLVATRAAGARQYVTDGESGLLCDIDDVEGLAGALRRAACDSALRERIVAGGWAAYEAEFERTRVVDTLLDTYRRSIEAGFCNGRVHPISRGHTGA
jgi:glycosyltransferase involved in cell wall biosynthesis